MYEDGSLDGCGWGAKGQLGVGCFNHREVQTVPIELPNHETPVYVAASNSYSLVISDKGTLYGFGNNSNGELGLGDEPTIEFPRAIPLPSDAIPVQIITAHERSIVVCQNGHLYGFGSNTEEQLGERTSSSSRFAQKVPRRLEHFEQLKPRAFAIGKYAVIVMSEQRKCYFYGIDMNFSLPLHFHFNTPKELALPSHVIPEQISFTYEHLLLLSEKGEIWQAGGHMKSGGQKNKDFTLVTLPKELEVRSIIAGEGSSFVFGKADECYAFGNNESCQLGHHKKEFLLTAERVPLRELSWWERPSTIKKSPSKLSPPETLFLEYQTEDNTDLITVIDEDNGQVIEITRPLSFNTSIIMSMLYAFYSNTAAISSTYFNSKKVGRDELFLKKNQGKHPVIFLDLGTLDFSSYSNFHDSYDQLIANLYRIHKPVLFAGYLKNKESDKNSYQEFALGIRGFMQKNPLEFLIKLLYKQYDKKVKILINHADIHLRLGLLDENYKYIESKLKDFINPVIGGFCYEGKNNQYISQTVLMGVHVSYLEMHGKAPVKRVHGIANPHSKYRDCLQSDSEALECDKNHFIYHVKITPDECEQIETLLQGTVLKMQASPEKSIKKDELNLLQCLMEIGILRPLLSGNEDQSISYILANQKAKLILQSLQKKWRIQCMKRVTVVFDIDNILATYDKCSLETILFFLRKGAIITVCGISHYIPPGVLELMRALFSNSLVKVVFFSSGKSERNEPFVKELLIKALGEKWYSEIASEIRILSRHHLRTISAYESENQQKKYGLPIDNRKKDIAYAIALEDSLEHAIFIDNAPEFVCCEQEEHYLHSETVQSGDFELLAKTETTSDSPEDSLFRKVNAIFYLAGVLLNCIKNKEKEPIPHKLFSLQFTPDEPLEDISPAFKPCWDEPKKLLAFYQEGLTWLQEQNPELTLITPARYKDAVAKPASERQESEMQDSLDHQYKENDCIVM